MIHRKNKTGLCLIALATIFLCGRQASHALASQGENAKTESELHLGLSASAFNKISAHLHLQKAHSFRTDVYFDKHKRGEFELRRTIPAAKLRIQVKDDSLVQQKSWLDAQSQHSSNGFVWLMSTRISARAKQPLAGETNERIRFSAQLLQTAVAQKTITETQKGLLENTWKSIVWPKLRAFDRVVELVKGGFLPAALVHKERWLIEIPSLKGNRVTLQLGRDSDVLGSGNPVSFELESELKGASSEALNEVSEAASDWLHSLGVAPDETTPSSSFDFFSRLEKIYP